MSIPIFREIVINDFSCIYTVIIYTRWNTWNIYSSWKVDIPAAVPKKLTKQLIYRWKCIYDANFTLSFLNCSSLAISDAKESSRKTPSDARYFLYQYYIVSWSWLHTFTDIYICIILYIDREYIFRLPMKKTIGATSASEKEDD